MYGEEGSSNYTKDTIDKKLGKLHRYEKEFLKTLDAFEVLMQNIDAHTRINNELKVLNDLTKFDKLYNKLTNNLYYNDFLSFFIRTQVNYLEMKLRD